MSILRSLLIFSQVDTSGITKGLNEGSNKIKKFSKDTEKTSFNPFKGLENSVSGMTGPLSAMKSSLAAIGVVAVVAAIGAAIKGIADMTMTAISRIDDLNDSAAKLGVSVQGLTELQYGASFSGISTDELDGALNKLNVKMGEAAGGAADAQNAFKQLGISVVDVYSGDTEAVFKKAADAIKALPTAAQQAAAAVDLFGKSGTKLLPFLQQGSEGFAKFAEEAKAMGITVSDADADMVGKAADAVDQIKGIWTGLSNQLAIQLAPIIKAIADWFISASKEGLNWGTVVKTSLSWVISGVGILADIWHTLKLAFKAAQIAILFGFATMVRGAATLASAMDSVLGLVGMDTGIGDAIDVFAKSLDEQTSQMGEEWMKDFTAKTPSEKLNEWLAGIERDAAKAKEEFDKGKEAVDKFGNALTVVEGQGKKFVDSLKEDIDFFGMSKEEKQIAKMKEDLKAFQEAAQNAVNPFQYDDQIEKLKQQIEDAEIYVDVKLGLEETKKWLDDFKSKAKSINEEMMTPKQKFVKQIADLQQMLNAKLISPDTAIKAFAKYKKDMEGTYVAPQALRQGTQEAESFINAWRNDTGVDPQIKALEGLQDINARQLGVLELINTNIANQKEEVAKF